MSYIVMDDLRFRDILAQDTHAETPQQARVVQMKPLFVPLKTEHYEAFADGSKRDELRRYGPRWNEHTCVVGRGVVLSKGYGKRHRMAGRIWRFKRQRGSLFGSTYRAQILDVFGTLDIEIAYVAIELMCSVKVGADGESAPPCN